MRQGKTIQETTRGKPVGTAVHMYALLLAVSTPYLLQDVQGIAIDYYALWRWRQVDG